MKRAARNSRVRGLISCVAVSVLAACAGPISQSSSPESDIQSADIQTIDGQSAEAAPIDDYQQAASELNTRMLMSSDVDGIGVQLADGANIAELRVEADSTKLQKNFKYEVSKIDAPPRLVIDIKGAPKVAGKTFDTADSGMVTKVRVGTHPDKSRIVLDLPNSFEVQHSVQPIDFNGKQGFAVSLTKVGAEPVESATLARNDTLTQEDSSEQIEAAALPAAGAGIAAVSDEGSEGNIITAEVADKPKLIGLSIEPVGNHDNMVIAQLSSARPHHLQRTAPSEYVLVLENAGLDSSAATTLLAAPGSGTIRSVRPVVEGNDLLVRIFTSPRTELIARANGGRIVVNAGSEGFDMRAQASPDTGGKAEVKESEAAKNAGAEVQVSGTDVDLGVSTLLDETPKYTGRLISLDLQDTDIDNALRIIAEVSNLNIIASQDVAGKVTLRLIDVPWDQALDVILKTNGLDAVREGNVVRIAPVEKLRLERESLKQAQQAQEELEPLQVRYIRISYAKAADLKPLVEAVISERGTVSYDERTNQLIVKDIMKGIKNVAELVAKLDLRTPQVLLETQIVEANRNLLRDLGSELGFTYIQSPATGNATGSNFPNSVAVGGTSDAGGNNFASFPAQAGASAISFLLDSADGTKSLDWRISALEREGRIRVISRPAVATTNNKQATIKSIEKLRVKTPSGGTVVGVGQGSSPNSGSSVATETIEIGIILEVTPQASPDYFVLLDINAKSSTIGSTTVDGIPSEIERSATSSVLVSSGQTFAMGGIYKIRDRDTVEGVPFFKDIPFLGYLFRNQLVDNTDEELLFFLTPRIIEGSFDDAAMKAST